MREPEDRLIEYALEELHRREEAPDLAERIRVAYERGVRGTGLNGTAYEIADGATELPRRRPRLLPSPRLAASIGVGLLGLAGFWLANRDGEDAGASASRPIALFASAGPADGVRLASGELAWIGGRGPVDLELDGGGLARVQPATLLRLGGRERIERIEVLVGELEATAGSGDLVVESGAGRFHVAAGASLSVRALTDRRHPASDALHTVRGWSGQLDHAARFLAVELEAGAADVEVDGRREHLRAGEERFFGTYPGGTSAIELFDKEEIDTLALRCLEKAPEPLKRPMMSPWDPGYVQDRDPTLEDLLARLSAQPAWWIYLEENLRWYLWKEDAGEVRDYALWGLVDDPSRVATRLVRDLWLAYPESFTTEHVVAMADRDVPEFVDEIEAIIDYADVAVLEPRLRREGEASPLLAATWLALRGRDEGVGHLLGAVKDLPQQLRGEDRGYDTFLAAMGLDALGVPEPWKEICELVDREARAALDRGEVDNAAQMACALEAFRGLRDERRAGRVPGLAFLWRAIAERLDERLPELGSADEVSALLDALRAD